MKLYIAGKVSSDSSFGTHNWRDDFCKELQTLSGLELSHLDPLSVAEDSTKPVSIFEKDVQLIDRSECVVVYLSDDISVGGSQEILIAKYLKKPVIGFAPIGGKFNGSTRKIKDKTINFYKDPFVFATCDAVCGTKEEVSEALKNIQKITPKGMEIIDNALENSR